MILGWTPCVPTTNKWQQTVNGRTRGIPLNGRGVRFGAILSAIFLPHQEKDPSLLLKFQTSRLRPEPFSRDRATFCPYPEAS